jgi:ribosomal protein S12 methylthiotransferase
LPYLDLPLQHINDAILHRMNRKANRSQTEQLIDRLRGRIPNLVLRTTMITGFPGETDEQFEELAEFVRATRFERLGVFAFSPEPDTPAAKLPNRVPPEVAEARRDALLAIQQEIAFAWNQSQMGRRMDILLDRYMDGENNALLGRSYADAPEIDGVVYVTGEDQQAETSAASRGRKTRKPRSISKSAQTPSHALTPGQLVPCEIVAAQGYDLVAAAIGTPR